MWDCPSPLYIDFETQSLADIHNVGGRLYAYHPSTRILILSFCIDDAFHVWIPDYIRCNLSTHSRLWPNELKPAKQVTLHRGSTYPSILRDYVSTRPVVAHNAYGFDEFVWNRFIELSATFLDTLYLARIAGRHGRLDQLGKQVLGVGKDRAKKLLPKLTKCTQTVLGGKRHTVYPVINPGDLSAFTTYAIGDVELLRRLWIEFADIEVETDVIEAHNKINHRGIAVDENLIDLVEQVGIYSVSQSAKEIARLTRGRLNEGNIRSVQQVHSWLASWGISITDDNGKPCLRKDVVQRYIDSPYIIDEYLSSATEIPPVVIDVLRHRMKALRITDAKVKRAKERILRNRIYDLHTYHMASTGRASSQGVQIHNLPRPPKNLRIDRLIAKIESEEFKAIRNDSKAIFDFIKEEMRQQQELIKGRTDAETEHDKEVFASLTVDDVCSALLRPSIKAKPKHKLVICDFAAVEARGCAWIAGEEKLLAVFHRQDTGLTKYGPYEEFASRMFGVRVEDVDSVQRQVAKSAVLGCQYGLGADKFRVYAASNGADLHKAGLSAEQIITMYRDTYTKIAGFRPEREPGNLNKFSNFRTNGIWHKLERAVKECVSTRVPQTAGKCRWTMSRNDLLCTLPSGRRLHYPDAKLEDIVPAYCYTMGLPLVPKATVTYQSTRGTKSLYGGLITENITQAICRDLLMCTLVICEANKWNPILHVHDEVVCEVEESRAEEILRELVRVMSTAPHWASGFHIACEGFVSDRYVKKPFKGSYELTSRELNHDRSSVLPCT